MRIAPTNHTHTFSATAPKPVTGRITVRQATPAERNMAQLFVTKNMSTLHKILRYLVEMLVEALEQMDGTPTAEKLAHIRRLDGTSLSFTQAFMGKGPKFCEEGAL